MKEFKIDWVYFRVITIVLLFIALIIGVNIKVKNDNYKTLLSNIENKQWAEAKTNVDTLGKYKNCVELKSNVYYHYYLENADKQIKTKNYYKALEDYKNAYQYNSNDKILKKKINEVEQTCKKLDEIERRKQEIERRKAEQERIKEEREAAQRNRAELIELQRMVNNSFVKTDFLNTGGSGSGFRFYTYPQSWEQLDYYEKQNVCNACARYIELKFNVSSSFARKYTWIMNVYNNSLMTYCEQ